MGNNKVEELLSGGSVWDVERLKMSGGNFGC